MLAFWCAYDGGVYSSTRALVGRRDHGEDRPAGGPAADGLRDHLASGRVGCRVVLGLLPLRHFHQDPPVRLRLRVRRELDHVDREHHDDVSRDPTGNHEGSLGVVDRPLRVVRERPTEQVSIDLEIWHQPDVGTESALRPHHLRHDPPAPLCGHTPLHLP